MNLKEYRRKYDLTQVELAEELARECGIKYDAPTISKMESGVVLPPLNVQTYIDSKTCEKPLASRSDARNIDERTTLPPCEKKSLKSPISNILLQMLSTASRAQPLSREYLARSLRTSDRAIRKAVEELRECGFRVASDSNHYGYWLCKSDAEYKAFRANYLAHAFRQLHIASMMDGFVEGQIQWEEQHG